MTKNPLTFKDIDPVEASTHSGIPRSPAIGTTANEVHNMGEVWCVTLWEARANLINKLGYAAGNQLMLQLVTDGMNLSPANPNFLQARDAILQADLVDNGGANRAELWAAFAKRGMGVSATSPASSDDHRARGGLRPAGPAVDCPDGGPLRDRSGGRAIHANPCLLHTDQPGLQRGELDADQHFRLADGYAEQWDADTRRGAV